MGHKVICAFLNKKCKYFALDGPNHLYFGKKKTKEELTMLLPSTICIKSKHLRSVDQNKCMN